MDYEQLRKELGHKERTVEDLISYLKTRTNDTVPNYSLLLGAGASFTSGITTGENLVSTWREEIYCKLSGQKEYEEKKAKDYLISSHSNWYSLSNEYSSLFEHKFDLPSQRRRFVEKQVDSKLPSIGYSYLVSLAKDRYFDTIYTTNFDDLLNEAFYQFSQTRPIVCAHDSSLSSISVSSNRPKIIKLHGDYLFDDIKSTLRETESLEYNTKEKLIQFSKEYGLIVIGYAGNDRSIMDVINYLLKTEEYLKNGIYWCIRDNDNINPELTKLLWRDRVFFVKINGFDEVMAEIHHDVKKGVSLRQNFTDSKKESIISSFTIDEYKLSESSDLIKKDIEDLKKHKDNMDISDLIRELNEKEFNGSEDDFKILLGIDRLIKDKKYSEAINRINKHLDDFDDSHSKGAFQRKLIQIYNLSGHTEDALSLCDELVESDPYNAEILMLKGSNIENLTKRCLFIKENESKFLNKYTFYNYLLVNGLSEREHTQSKSVFSLDVLFENVEKSIKLEPSVDNPAYNLKLNFIEEKYRDKIDKKSKEKECEELNKLLDEIGKVNNEHYKYLELKLNKLFLKKEYENAKCAVKYILNVYDISSKSKKRSIVRLLCDNYPSFIEFKNNDELYQDWREFMQNSRLSDNDKNSVPFLICNAKFQLMIEKDHEKCIEYIIKASVNKEAHYYAGTIIDYLITISEDYSLANTFLDSVEHELLEYRTHNHKADILIAKGEFEIAIDEIERSYKLGAGFEDYLVKLSFAYLKCEKYQKVVNFIDANYSKVKCGSTKDILTINREKAQNEQGNNINDIAIRNIISHGYSEHLVLAAECLNGKKSTAIRLLNVAIEKNYYDYFSLKIWPVIPDEYLAESKVGLNLSGREINNKLVV